MRRRRRRKKEEKEKKRKQTKEVQPKQTDEALKQNLKFSHEGTKKQNYQTIKK